MITSTRFIQASIIRFINRQLQSFVYVDRFKNNVNVGVPWIDRIQLTAYRTKANGQESLYLLKKFGYVLIHAQ